MLSCDHTCLVIIVETLQYFFEQSLLHHTLTVFMQKPHHTGEQVVSLFKTSFPIYTELIKAALKVLQCSYYTGTSTLV